MTEHSPDTTPVPSPGQLLKQKRRENGLAIEDIADHLLLSVAQVKALEMDDFEKLPGATYIMGYWRSYAGLLGIDASESINLHKIKLETTSSAIALERNHQRAHGHQEKSRKKSALLFFLLSALFLSGIWYWQNPDDNPINQWVENLSNRQLAVRNTSTETSDNQFDEEDTAFEFIPEDAKQAVITLPEPNFSEEFESGEAEVVPEELLKSADEPIVSVVSSLAKLEQFTEIDGSGNKLIVAVADSGAGVTVNAVDEVESISGVNATDQPEEGNPDFNESESSSIPAPSMVVTEVNNPVESAVEESVDNVDESEVVQSPVVEVSLSQVSGDVTGEIVVEEAGETPTPVIAEAEENAERYDPDSPKWISFKVENQTWLDVRDSNAEKLIYRNANAGESIKLNGRPPFYIFIGAVDGVLVEYLRKPVEYGPDENGLHSRFTLGEFE
jgi:cytoskeleton protein RodZ